MDDYMCSPSYCAPFAHSPSSHVGAPGVTACLDEGLCGTHLFGSEEGRCGRIGAFGSAYGLPGLGVGASLLGRTMSSSANNKNSHDQMTSAGSNSSSNSSNSSRGSSRIGRGSRHFASISACARDVSTDDSNSRSGSGGAHTQSRGSGAGAPARGFGLPDNATRVVMLSSLTHHAGILNWSDMQVRGGGGGVAVGVWWGWGQEWVCE